MTLLSSARRWARRLGLEVHRHNPTQSHAARLQAMLEHHRIDAAFDVGANDGGYGSHLRELGFGGPILSFEPLAAAHAALQQRARSDPAWHVMPRCALGAEPAQALMQVAANSVSSSLRPMLDAHRQAAPQSAAIGTEPVGVCRLDDVAWPQGISARRWLLKIDTQGYEREVLDGAPRTLQSCVGIQIELSLLPLYEGQTLHFELTAWLLAQGFELWDLQPGFADPTSGRLLQMDGVFFRRPA